MWENIQILINNTNFVITFISVSINIFIGFMWLKHKFDYLFNTRYLKKLLAYTDEPVQIYQAVNDYISVEGFHSKIISIDSIEGLYNIINMLSLVGKEYKFVNQNDTCKNEICIGGFLYNKRVNSYFLNHFGNFKYYINTKYKDYYEKTTSNSPILKYTNHKFGFYIDETLFLEIIPDKKDYIFVIKLTPDDFKMGEKTVHILFGGRLISTLKATEYLYSQYKNIYKKFKNKHYFFAVEFNLVDNSFNHQKGIIDLTEKMFKTQ